MTKENFTSYYNCYLNHNKDTSVVLCEQREVPLNEHYYYHIIATEIEGRDIYSVHPDLYDSFMMLKQQESIKKTLEQFQLEHPSLMLRHFYRMSLGGYKSKLNNEARVFTEEDLEYSIQTLTEKEKISS